MEKPFPEGGGGFNPRINLAKIMGAFRPGGMLFANPRHTTLATTSGKLDARTALQQGHGFSRAKKCHK